MNWKGIVLAGGKSRRFGEDKALATMDGITLIERAVSLLRQVQIDPIVITNKTRKYSFLNCQIERDLIPDMGPLGGIYTACELFKGSDSTLLVLTCDMPHITVSELSVLMKDHERENKITLFDSGRNRLQPFPGVYESDLYADALCAFKKEKLSMQEFIRSVSNYRVIPCEFNRDRFLNVNDKHSLVQRQG